MHVSTFASRRTWAAAIVALITALTVMVGPSEASAGTCGTPGCGGTVVNVSTHQINIVNCWHNYTDSWVGNGLPPCANIWSQNMYNAGWFLQYYQWSTYDAGYYYYDTDAFQAPAGCTTYGHFSGPGTFAYDRHGKSALWKRVYGVDQAVITAVVC